MSEFTGHPEQVAKCFVMGSLLGEYFAKWGKCGDHEVAMASEIADRIVAASAAPAPKVAPPPAPNPAMGPAPMRQGMVPGAQVGMRPMGGGISLPSMPSPDAVTSTRTTPDVPGHNSPEQPQGGVLDLSQPR